jgi:prepilin-type N-terminal cleavage/methylation domain-containing protein
VKRAGYTLLEVLVATAIFAIAAVAVLSALSSSTQNAGRITDRDRAVLLAREKLDELLIDHALLKNVPLQGVFDPAQTGNVPCGWRAELTTFEAGIKNPDAPALERIQVEVWWGPENDRHTFRLSGYRRGALSEAEAKALADAPSS